MDELGLSIAITFVSWIAGLLINAPLRQTGFYQARLSNLNFLPGETLNRILGINILRWLICHTPLACIIHEGRG